MKLSLIAESHTEPGKEINPLHVHTLVHHHLGSEHGIETTGNQGNGFGLGHRYRAGGGFMGGLFYRKMVGGEAEVVKKCADWGI